MKKQKFGYAFQCTKGHLKGMYFGFYSSKEKARKDAKAMKCDKIRLVKKEELLPKIKKIPEKKIGIAYIR